MPGYKGHIVGALSFSLLTLVIVFGLHTVAPLRALEWGVCAVLGGLFPDIDTKSMGQKWLYRILFCVGVILLMRHDYLFMSVLLLIALTPLMMRHRGLLHTLWFPSALILYGVALLYTYAPQHTTMIVADGLFFWVGVLSHLALDYYW